MLSMVQNTNALTNGLLTVGGDRFMAEPRRSCGPMEECRRIGNPLPPGVPPGDDAQDGAMRIFGVIRVLSDRRRFGNALATRKKLLSGDDGELPNHQPPSTPEPNSHGCCCFCVFLCVCEYEVEKEISEHTH